MYSKLKPFSFMDVSNSEMLLSEKDLSSTMEFSFLVRHPLEFQEDRCQIASFRDVVEDDEPHQQKEDRLLQEEKDRKQRQEEKCKLLPSLGEFKVPENGDEDESNDGFKTPTSLDQKIPAMLKCPPAPRKPKSLPISSPKRKVLRRRMLLDLTKEIESLFPPALLADLGNKIKKVRQGSDFK